MPLAGACVKTGPKVLTAIGSSPANAGYRFGTTRTSQLPFGPYVSSAGGMASSLPGQNGHRDVSACTSRTGWTNASGRAARSAAMTTQRPVNGSSLSWLTMDRRNNACSAEDTRPAVALRVCWVHL